MWLDVAFLCMAWLTTTPRLHQQCDKTGWWPGLGCSLLRRSGETQRSEETPWLSPLPAAEQWNLYPFITNVIFMVIAPFLTQNKLNVLWGKRQMLPLLDAGTQNQGAFPLDCLPCHAKEVSDPRDHCEGVIPSSQASHKYETHAGWMTQGQS